MPITPFRPEISDDTLDELRARLAHVRWPEAETVADVSQGRRWR